MTDKKQAPMYILTIKGTNYMGLEIDLKLGKGVTDIAGENKAGKSRVISTVELLLGKEFFPEVPLSKGKTKGELVIQLGDEKVEYTIQWRITAKGGMTLKGVKKSTGEDVREPQEFLKALCGQMIDPWHFLRLAMGSTPDRKKATDIFKSLVVIDCDIKSFLEKQGHNKNDAIKTLQSLHADEPLAFLKAYDKMVCEKRKDWKDLLKKLEGSVGLKQDQVPADKRNAEMVDVQALMEEYKELDQRKTEWTLAQESLVAAGEEAEQIEKELAEAKAVVGTRLKSFNALPEPDVKKIETIQSRINNVNAENAIAQTAAELREESEQLDKAETQIEKITESIERIRDFYRETLESSEIPVENLEIVDDKLMYKGLPLSQASKTEALREVSIPIGVALNPGLKTFVIRDGDSMTAETREILSEAIDKYGMQALLEIAMSDGPAVLEFQEKGGVFIRNGVAKNT